MPFRVLFNYRAVAVVANDPSDDSLAEYIDWLRTELETAEAHQEARAARRDAEAETPTPGDRCP